MLGFRLQHGKWINDRFCVRECNRSVRRISQYSCATPIPPLLSSPRRLAFNEQGIFRHYPELEEEYAKGVILGPSAPFAWLYPALKSGLGPNLSLF